MELVVLRLFKLHFWVTLLRTYPHISTGSPVSSRSFKLSYFFTIVTVFSLISYCWESDESLSKYRTLPLKLSVVTSPTEPSHSNETPVWAPARRRAVNESFEAWVASRSKP